MHMTEQFNYCHVVGQTDVGRKRAANEDSMGNAITINGLVAVVCDGMGGHVGGATASKIAVNTIIDNLNTNYYDDPRIAIGESIDIANRAILNEAKAHPELSGMGSTCVLLIVRNGKVYIGHVGDSRIYLIRSKKIVQLTRDHSYVQMLVDRGEITKEQAERHPRRNEITNALGISNMTPATVADDAIIPEAGDCFLLCSDGLSGMVPNNIISKVISRQSEMNAQDRVNRLIALANENGGVDNITAQMVEFPVAPGTVGSGKKVPLWLKILIPTLLVVALGLGAYMLVKEKDSSVKGRETETPKALPEEVNVIQKTIGETIPFVEKGEIVTLIFSENSVKFKQGEKQIYCENNAALSSSTLEVESTDDITISSTPSLPSTIKLEFTDKFPGDKVIFSIKSVDGETEYQYTIKVSKSIQLDQGLKKDTGKSEKGAIGGTASEQPRDEKVSTIDVKINYAQLNKKQKLLFNYSSKTPFFILDKNEFKVESGSIDEVKYDEIQYDGAKWLKYFNPNNRQLSFTFKEETSSDSFSFIIPCVLKDTTTEIVLRVQLLPGSSSAQEEEREENIPADSDEEDDKNGGVYYTSL